MHLRGQPHPLALERRALELLPELGGGDAGAQQVAEQAQHRGGARVDRGQRLGAADDGAEPARRRCRAEARARRRRAARTDAPSATRRGRAARAARRPGRRAATPPRRTPAGRARWTGAVGCRPRRSRAPAVAGRHVERRDGQAERVAHLLERALRQLRQRDRAHQRPRRASRRRRGRRAGPRRSRPHATVAFAMPVRVLLADDHRLMREGTAALLGADERIEVVGLAHDGREALALAERRQAGRRAARPQHAGGRRARGVRAAARSRATAPRC